MKELNNKTIKEATVENLKHYLLRLNDYENNLIKNDDTYTKLKYRFTYNEIKKLDNEHYQVYFKIGEFQYLKILTKHNIDNYGDYYLSLIEKEVENEFKVFMKKINL